MNCEFLSFYSPNGGRPAKPGSYQFDLEKGIAGIFIGYVGNSKIIVRGPEIKILKKILDGEEIDPVKELELLTGQTKRWWKKFFKRWA
jgi:hypothetical protein